MIGPAPGLVQDVGLPPGVTLRTIRDRADLQAAQALWEQVSGRGLPGLADDLADRFARGTDMEVWVAESTGEIIAAGRLEPVAGTDVAGIWGGVTRADWRRRGVYRALTAERARSAIRLGKTLLQSDSTEYSRPILERAGLSVVTTTTPYAWRR